MMILVQEMIQYYYEEYFDELMMILVRIELDGEEEEVVEVEKIHELVQDE